MARKISENFQIKKTDIENTAVRLFAKMGYERTSVDDIARESLISKALIYHYYKSKEAILYSAIANSLNELYDNLQVIDNADPQQRLLILIKTTLNCYRNAHAAHRVQLNELDSLSEENREKIIILNRKIVDIFSNCINAIINDNTHIKAKTMLLLSMLNWHDEWFKERKGLNRDELSQLIYDIFVHGIGGK